MHPGATLVLDVGTQRDLWPGGRWPLLGPTEAGRAGDLCRLAGELGMRSGGVYCAHADPVEGLPVHCVLGGAGAGRSDACGTARPEQVWSPAPSSGVLDRRHAIYLATGCATAIDAVPALAAVFDHLTAGVRDAVVFGAGVELGIAHVVEALLRRRIRTHLALDASGAVDDVRAQALLADWKRRTVDVATAATIERLLRRAGPDAN